MRTVVVGSGISGLSAAAILSAAGHQVQIFEERNHIGGNCFDRKVEGVTIHEYGPHCFHTNDFAVYAFLSRYTGWRNYEHRVVADTKLGRVSIPYSKVTEQQLGRPLSDEEIRDLIFRDYSAKQWGIPFDSLPPAIRNRLPVRRADADDRYFTDSWQGQPAEGYSPMLRRMAEGSTFAVGCGQNEWRKWKPRADLVVYTGKIDAYFDYCYGELPYRSLLLETSRTSQRLPFAVINQCNENPHTRIYDHSWFLGEVADCTYITKEFPCAHVRDRNIPFYPMRFGDAAEKYARYRELEAGESNTLFLGRLATYSYLDMWMAVAQVQKILKKRLGIEVAA